MPGTYSKLLYHIVFCTKGRMEMMKGEAQHRIHEYIGGIVRSEGGVAYQIGGMPDHIHLLVRWRADEALSTLMRLTKTNSSRWIHETFPSMGVFAWQSGYAAFTVSQSQKNVVARYIANQEQHHRKRTFLEELKWLFAAHEIEFESRFILT